MTALFRPAPLGQRYLILPADPGPRKDASCLDKGHIRRKQRASLVLPAEKTALTWVGVA